jgi:hypothetical protein
MQAAGTKGQRYSMQNMRIMMDHKVLVPGLLVSDIDNTVFVCDVGRLPGPRASATARNTTQQYVITSPL